jgi:3-oxoacyl-[acyl-carrier-protein] synthase-3
VTGAPTASLTDAQVAPPGAAAAQRAPGNGARSAATPATVADPWARPGIAVAGWGTALPERRVTNHDLAQVLDTSDAWIVDRTGIRERRVAGPGESTGPLAIRAARAALARARLTPADVDLVVVATSTPERPIPSTASLITAALGIEAGGFDLNAACAGFVYALTTTAGLLGVGAGQTALLVGADTMTSVIDPEDRTTAILFGDGAAAVVLTTAGEGDAAGADRPAPGLVASDLMHDPLGVDLLVVEAGGSGRPATAESVADRAHYLRMDGQEVFRRAVRGVTQSVERTLARAGCTPADVDLFVPHQANVRIVNAVLSRVGIAPERTLTTIDRYGNTSACSVPLSLAGVAEAGRVAPGDLVLMCGFGAGMAVGTALWRWGTTGATLDDRGTDTA